MKDSPLFRVWTKGKVKPMSRQNMSTLVRNAFLRVGIKKVSAHSLRRYVQTQMEEAGVNVNWIEQAKLIASDGHSVNWIEQANR